MSTGAPLQGIVGCGGYGGLGNGALAGALGEAGAGGLLSGNDVTDFADFTDISTNGIGAAIDEISVLNDVVDGGVAGVAGGVLNCEGGLPDGGLPGDVPTEVDGTGEQFDTLTGAATGGLSGTTEAATGRRWWPPLRIVMTTPAKTSAAPSAATPPLTAPVPRAELVLTAPGASDIRVEVPFDEIGSLDARYADGMLELTSAPGRQRSYSAPSPGVRPVPAEDGRR
ncbi:hypothetical protein [Nocardia ignorata]|uniref:Uncharacterized protein n=1 Tax=Nocardia ignorata TaxID=145285 RepID=A0A4R6PWR5_NOCIG|nr:hypothetical protein [Nocardia ignorata]TDP43062.1 hypothetical protein DFR75_1012182 [Nocardia ignorata]